ncbi:MAG: P-loop NTPase, partial [Clostridia bacterium]|nr:P-loop NTPase [Clostridia bacterium]
MSECTHDCSSCSQDCGERKQDLHAKTNEFSHIKKVVAVSSGKGGVGKSSVTCLLAVMMARRGYKVGVLDADITGPSSPRAFGINQKAQGSEIGILPAETHMGIKIMSINLLLEEEDAPVIWRGPVIAGVVKQFWSDV